MLLTNAILIDPEAGSETPGHLLLHAGRISEVLPQDTDLTDKRFQLDLRIDCAGKYLAPGIIDLGVKVCEPGERHKESFRTAGAAAGQAGGRQGESAPTRFPEIGKAHLWNPGTRKGLLCRLLPLKKKTKTVKK